MVKRNGNVISVLRNMQSNQIGRLIPRPVAQGSTNVVVALCFHECRRVNLITNKAFCDALVEEKSKVSQGLMPNLQGQVSDFMSSMPINNPTISTPLGIS